MQFVTALFAATAPSVAVLSVVLGMDERRASEFHISSLGLSYNERVLRFPESCGIPNGRICNPKKACELWGAAYASEDELTRAKSAGVWNVDFVAGCREIQILERSLREDVFAPEESFDKLRSFDVFDDSSEQDEIEPNVDFEPHFMQPDVKGAESETEEAQPTEQKDDNVEKQDTGASHRRGGQQ